MFRSDPWSRKFTRRLLHTDAFTNKALTNKHFYPKKFCHTNAFKHKHLYMEKFLHTNHFIHRRFLRRHFYTQTFLHTKPSTHKHLISRHFHTEILAHEAHKQFHTERPDPWHRNLTTSKSQSYLNFWYPTSISYKRVAINQGKSHFASTFYTQRPFRTKGPRWTK